MCSRRLPLKDWMDSKWALLRGSLIGFFLGILPGGGAVIASFGAYAMEKEQVLPVSPFEEVLLPAELRDEFRKHLEPEGLLSVIS